MKKIILLVVLTTALVEAPADAYRDVAKLLTGMVQAYREGRPPDAFKPALSVLPFKNLGDASRRLGLAETLGTMVEETMQKSVDFVIVDRSQLDAALKEIELALSGLGDPSSVTLGKIRNAQLLLDGNVGETPDGFKLSIRLIEVETAHVVYASSVDIARDDLVRASEEYADRKYVSVNGLGIELAYTAYYLLKGPMAEAEGGVESPFMNVGLVYRPARWLMLSLGFDTCGGQLWLGGTKESVSYTFGDSLNLSDPTILPDTTYRYSKTRSYLGIDMGAGFVLNITRRINATIGGIYRFAPGLTLTQKYDDFPSPADPDITESVYVLGVASDIFMAVPFVKLQFFLNPRLALNVRYDYTYQLPMKNDSYFYRYSIGGIYASGSNGVFAGYYDLDPAMDPAGNAHVMDMTGHRASVGVAIYL